MTKGIAVRTILLLVIGIIVVAILTYLVYSYTRSTVISLSACRSKITGMCTRCIVAGCLIYGPFPLDLIQICGRTRASSEIFDPNTGCAQYDEYSGWNNVQNCWNVNMGVKDLCKQVGVG